MPQQLCSPRSAPKDAIAFHVQGTPGVKVYVVHETQSVKLPSSVTRWPLATGTEVLLTMEAISKDVGDEKVGDSSPAAPSHSLGDTELTGCDITGQDFLFW